MATPPFPEIVSSVDVRVPAASGEGYIAANDNQLLYQYPGALGGKTGFTDDAGNTYVGMAARDGRRLVVTMLNGTQQPRRQWMQGASLLDWGFALPAGTPPVGKLVGSLAEATAVSAPPTPSTGVPSSSAAACRGVEFGRRRPDHLVGHAERHVLDRERGADSADPGRHRRADRGGGRAVVVAQAAPEQATHVRR